MTDSNEDRMKNKELPGIEIMFKAQGTQKEQTLEEYADSLNLRFKFSVVTEPSGSYKEEDLFDMQDK